MTRRHARFIAAAWSVALLGAAASASAQHHQSAYADYKDRPIKALSAQQVDDLREGRGMGMSLPAELNGVPGPLHVLELREPMKITPEQAARIERIRDEMKLSSKRIGHELIAAEAALDQAFAGGTADEELVARMTGRIGALQAQLRAEHLKAHLRTGRLLSPHQVLAYKQARGYEAPSAEAAPAHPHRH